MEPGTMTQRWKHQEEALAFALKRPHTMLAMAMGTGKSKVAIDLISERKAQRVLIVCPKSVVHIWPSEFNKHDRWPAVFAPKNGNVASKTESLKRAMETTGRPVVFVVNYETMWRDPFLKVALSYAWDWVILDESHRIKSPGGVASRAAHRLGRQAKYRLCLTGTPMPHSPMDLYAQYRFLDSSIFGTSFVSFKAHYAIMGGYLRKQVISFRYQDELREKMYSLAFRVSKDVLDLPEAQHESRTFNLQPETRRIYESLEHVLVAQVEEGIISASNALVKLLRLQQLTSGYIKDDDGVERKLEEGKQDLLDDLLQDMPRREPIIIFCRFHSDLNAVRRIAERQDRSHGELSGRRNDLDKFYSKECDLLAVQLQSGGVGIDLTRAHYAIYYSLGFSLGDYEQSLARLHRPGQTKPVQYYHLIAEGTVDEKVYQALRDRREVVGYVLGGLMS
jgi:SNF2 family DNA or RNA helicase